MRVLITGANGQLGYALQKTAPAHISSSGTTFELLALTRRELDLAQIDQLAEVLQRYNPDAIINAAAYTAVDKAESDAELARQINTVAVGEIARWCAQKNIPLVQISTDFVFDGKHSSPYLTDHPTNPLGVYAQTKRDGELLALNNCDSAYVVRTGWVYCEQGANFVKTMLRLGAERDVLGVVADQVGTPTYAVHLAQMIWVLLAAQPKQKIFHFSDAGVTSWYDFADAIFALAQEKNLLSRAVTLKPIGTQDYPTPAQRPAYSVLDKSSTWSTLAITPVHWRIALSDMLDAYKIQQN